MIRLVFEHIDTDRLELGDMSNMWPKRYAVFYHLWAPADCQVWRFIVDEQIKRIERARLRYHADVYCCITGPLHAEIESFVSTYAWLKILTSTSDESKFEGETLLQLYQACLDQEKLDAVAYVHAKGIRHFDSAPSRSFRALNTWRHFLEWGTIDRWSEAVRMLDAVDLVGVNFRDSPWPHFSGNFWWASARYIRTLPSPISSQTETHGSVDVDQVTLERISYERWVGLNDPKVFSFYDLPFNIPGEEWTFGFNLYTDDIYPYYERQAL